MALNNKPIVFNIDKDNIYNLSGKQSDTTGARSFIFRLIKDTNVLDLTGLRVMIGGKKADGKNILNDCKIVDATKGVVEVELTTQMQVVAGILHLELIILKGETRLSTVPFEVEIIPSVTNFNAVQSGDEFGALNNALNKVDEWDKTFTETSGKIEEKYTERLNSVSSQLSENGKNLNVFSSIFIKYGLRANGKKERLSSIFSTLEEANEKYPCATSLNDLIDWCAIQTYLDNEQGTLQLPAGQIDVNKTIVLKKGTSIIGSKGTRIRLDDNSNCTIITNEFERGASGDNVRNTSVGLKDIKIMGNAYNQTSSAPAILLQGCFITSYLDNVYIDNCFGRALELREGMDIKIDQFWCAEIIADCGIYIDCNGSSMINFDHTYVEWTQKEKVDVNEIETYKAERYSQKSKWDHLKADAIKANECTSLNFGEMHFEGHNNLITINEVQNCRFERLDCSFFGDMAKENNVITFLNSSTIESFILDTIRFGSRDNNVNLIKNNSSADFKSLKLINSINSFSNFIYSKQKQIKIENEKIYYFDKKNGTNDISRANGSLEKPFLDFTALNNILNKELTANLTLILKTGEYPQYDFSGFYGSGNLYINAYESDTPQVDFLYLSNNAIPIRIANISITGTINNPAVVCKNCSCVDFEQINSSLNNNKTQNGFMFDNTKATISNSYIKNKNIAVYASKNSLVFLNNNTGDTNNIGISSLNNSKVGVNGTKPSATKENETNGGGVINQ